MEVSVLDLGDRFKGRAGVIRVDFNANAKMVSQLGGGVCPTYVLFQDGKPIHTESFPVSADILESRLSEIIDQLWCLSRILTSTSCRRLFAASFGTFITEIRPKAPSSDQRNWHMSMQTSAA